MAIEEFDVVVLIILILQVFLPSHLIPGDPPQRFFELLDPVIIIKTENFDTVISTKNVKVL